MKNKVKVILLNDLTNVQINLMKYGTGLRYAKRKDDTEIINHTQLGKLKRIGVKFQRMLLI